MHRNSTPKPNPLRSVRLANGLGLRETARRADIDPGQLSRIESDKGGLTIDSLYRLAIVLGLKELAKYLRPFTSERKSETV